MTAEFWKHQPVDIEGNTFDAKGMINGNVSTEPGVGENEPDDIDGAWVVVSTGRLADGSVRGITLSFESEMEKKKFLLDCNSGSQAN